MVLDTNILLAILSICVLLVVLDMFFLRLKLKKILRSKTNTDLGQVISSINKDMKELEKFQKDIEEYLKNVEKRLRSSIQTTETVRFNAFRDSGVGANQSFATAFLNEEGNGTVLSSLYSRDRVSIFSKPIDKFDSDIELSEEENRAVTLVKNKITAR